MIIFNDVHIQSAWVNKDGDYNIINDYKVGDFVETENISGYIESIHNVNLELSDPNLLQYETVNTKIYEFHDIEPIVINSVENMNQNYDHYCIITPNNIKLIQGHDVFNQYDRCIVTVIDKNIFKEPCIYTGYNETHNKLFIHFEVINLKRHIFLSYNSFEPGVSGQLIEDKNVYISKEV